MEEAAGGPGLPERVEIRRSTRRRRTVSARVEADKVVVLMPAGLTREQEQEHVRGLVERLRRRRHRDTLSTQDLAARAARLSRAHLQGRAVPVSVRWVTNQGARWGSTTVGARTIRLSAELDGMPEWVVDAVLVHELAHLLEPGHGPAFRAWVQRYPRYGEATAFLAGVTWARRGPGGQAEPVDPIEAGEDDPVQAGEPGP